MARKFKIQELLDCVKTNHVEKAQTVLEDVKKELGIARKIDYISPSGKKSLKMIEEIIKEVSSGKIKSAKSKYEEAERGFRLQVGVHLQRKLDEIKDVKGLQNDNPQPVRRKTDEERNDHRSRDSVDNLEYSKDARKGKPTKQRTELERIKMEDQVPELIQAQKSESKVSTHDMMFDQGASAKSNDSKFERSKRASLKMRQNNPDIADLSDPNRPTKIAEKFSELYDNEWTEAFEELSRKNKKEEESIEILLAVVTEAYKFCTEVAEKQTKSIMKLWNAIFEFGPDDYKDKSPSVSSGNDVECESLIVQYRKKIASLALPNLIKDFSERKIKVIKSKAKGLPATLPAFELYVGKAVELTWWMCVQEPPIFLCPPSEDRGYDKNLYRAYTKSGISPQFFVWPALRLHTEGGVLMKGVVQFR